MSDHCEMLGDHGLLYKGCRIYEGLVHLPLIFSCPGRINEGLISNALVDLIDVPSTIFELTKNKIPNCMQGESLVPILSGEQNPNAHKKYVVTEYNDSMFLPDRNHSHGSMYFDGKYKICFYHDMGIGEINNLEEDPEEFNNLWFKKEHNEIKSKLLFKHFTAMMNTASAGVERIANYQKWCLKQLINLF